VEKRLYRHPKALADVEESAVYIGRDDLDAALRFLAAVEATSKMLLDNNELGAVREFERFELAGLRSFPVVGFGNYLVFYRTTDRGIEVLRVLHGARDLGAVLEEDPAGE
jgi:toxin ParE1/3/4